MGGGKKNNQNKQNAQQNNKGGAETKVNDEKKEEKKEEKKDENPKKEEHSKKEPIILKVQIHCEGCSTKLVKCLKCFEGVEEVNVDMGNQKVVVKGPKADPTKVFERVRKSYSRNVELISPKPKPNAPKQEKKEPEKKEEPVKVVVFKMFMHCEGCANDIKKNIEKMKGILTVQVDMGKSTVVVKGIFDPKKLVEMIAKRMGKNAEIVNTKQESEQKGKDKGNGGGDDKNDKNGKYFHYPPQYSNEHIYPNQLFSEENVFSCSIM